MPSDYLPPERIRAIREAHSMTLAEAAEHIGVSLRSWQRWEQPRDQSTARTPKGAARKALLAMEREAYARQRGIRG